MSEEKKVKELTEIVNQVMQNLSHELMGSFQELSRQTGHEVDFFIVLFDHEGRNIKAMASNSEPSLIRPHIEHYANQLSAAKSSYYDALLKAESPSNYVN